MRSGGRRGTATPANRRVLIGFGVYCAILIATQIYRWHLWTYGTDLGTFSQAILDPLGGFRNGPEEGTHYRFHWSPLIGSLYPILAATHSALSLEIAQTILIGASAFPMYALVRAHASERLAVFCGILPLIYPPLVAIAFLEFHEIVFFPAIAVALVWAADRERWRWFAALALLGAIVREEVCVSLAFAGLALVIVALRRTGTPRRGLFFFEPITPRALAAAGAILAAINLAALTWYFIGIVPPLGGWQPSRFYEYDFAKGPIAVAGSIVTHPAYLREIVTPGRFGYLLEAFAPLVFLPLLSPWMIFALPGFAEILLSSDPLTWRMGWHYGAIWIPWALIATAHTLVRFENADVRFALRGSRAIAAVCAVFFIAFNPMHPFHYFKALYPHDRVADLAALVPHDASLITHDEWFTHLAIDFPKATVFEYTPHEYALYADDYPSAYFRDVQHPALTAALSNGRAHEIKREGNVALYRFEPRAGAPTSPPAGPTHR